MKTFDITDLRTDERYSTFYTAKLTGTRPGTKIRKVMKHIKENGPSKKIDIVRNALGKTGTNNELRGYWCTNLASLRASRLIAYDYDTKLYHLTEKGLRAISDPQELPSIFL